MFQNRRTKKPGETDSAGLYCVWNIYIPSPLCLSQGSIPLNLPNKDNTQSLPLSGMDSCDRHRNDEDTICFNHIALSVTAWVQAPSGFLVITGSEPPDSKVLTVRS